MADACKPADGGGGCIDRTRILASEPGNRAWDPIYIIRTHTIGENKQLYVVKQESNARVVYNPATKVHECT